MPYRWSSSDTPDRQTLILWPHRSLAPSGFVWFIGLTAAGLSLPIFSQLGHATLWVILAFVMATIAALWTALRKSDRDRSITETLTLSPDRLTLIHQGPKARQSWEANPHWVRLTLHVSAGPVPHYLTLSGGGREVELGAFLTEGERVALKSDLEARLGLLK